MTQTRQRDLLKQIALVLAVAIVYAILARLGLLLAINNTNTSPVWPPSGFAFAALLILGKRVWPGITIGAFVGNITAFLAHPPPVPMSHLVAASLVISIGNTLEALVGVFLLGKAVSGRNPLDRTQDVLQFTFVAVGMCLVAGTIGPTCLCLIGIAGWNIFPLIWSTWWMGDATGVLIVTPMLLSWRYHVKMRWTPERIGEITVILLTVALILDLLFGEAGAIDPLKSQAYLILPPLLWLVFRFQQRDALTLTTLVSVIAVRETAIGRGAFVRGSMNTSLELLQVFVSVITISVMMLGAACAERTRAERELESHAEREHKIADTLQDALQPSEKVHIPGLRSAVYYKPALDEASVGGDFYDMFRIAPNEYAVVIGDISGKGLAAAIQVTAVRNMLRSLLYLRTQVSVAITELNNMIVEHDLLNGFTTVLAGVYNTETGGFTYVSCGHESALLYQSDTGTIVELTATGPPLGVTPGYNFGEHSHSLSSSDVLLLFTDGLSEARVESTELLGIDRLSEILTRHATKGIDVEHLLARVVRDAENSIREPFRDDVCLIALSVAQG